MKTKIMSRYIVAYQDGEHKLLEKGCVVFEEDRILFVGHHFDGEVDEVQDFGNSLISPGFIDLDALGDIDHTLIFSEFPQERMDDLRWSQEFFQNRKELLSQEQENFKSLYAYTCLLRNGITTAMPITSVINKKTAETYEEIFSASEHAIRLGLRVYLGPSYLSAKHGLNEQGDLTILPLTDEEIQEGLENAEKFIRYALDKGNPLLNPVLVPERIELQTEASLRKTKELSDHYDVPVRIHSAQGGFEYDYIKSISGLSPIAYLDSLGFLDGNTLIPHAIYASGTKYVEDRSNRDQEILVKRGTSVIHCPLVYSRSGTLLDSFGRYRRLGVNLCMGTDTFPPDMIMNLRMGSALAKSVDDNRVENHLKSFYDAMTLGGAKALGRQDLGRLCSGAKADLIVLDLDAFELGVLDDPLQTLFLSGNGSLVQHSLIEGKWVMKDRQIQGVDLDALQRKAQDYYDDLKESYRTRSRSREENGFFHRTLAEFKE